MGNESLTGSGGGVERARPLVRLQTLGGVWARRPGEDGPAPVPEKPVVVLAYLLLARPWGVKVRDTVAAIFWPELDAGPARRALRQAIHVVRKSLGEAVIRSVGKHTVEVSGDLVPTDVARFEAARASGDLETALALYQGEFMAGVRLLNTGSELEDWVTAERFELRRAAAGCATELARRAAAAGDGVAAVHWGRRALAISGGDEAVLRQLLRQCRDAGQPGTAVELYECHCDWLRRQGDLEPLPSTRALFGEVAPNS